MPLSTGSRTGARRPVVRHRGETGCAPLRTVTPPRWVMPSTHERTLSIIPLEVLAEYAVDVPDDASDL